ncbi:hypothetical protein BLNAU_7188 [Blattamonas nauphoetae]|uniref:Uncharacterized protein n=1 Tax=Blattamonas nauphoetae TaxID=2049346 RepID=A0ABQ9Y227_9EUKA|nr:hypothetical protein BLNAU_7188 [Blattamonas nauphoetae]
MIVSPPPLPSTLDASKGCCDFSKWDSKSNSPPIVLIDGTIVLQCQIQIQQFKTLSPASKTRENFNMVIGISLKQQKEISDTYREKQSIKKTTIACKCRTKSVQKDVDTIVI